MSGQFGRNNDDLERSLAYEVFQIDNFVDCLDVFLYAARFATEARTSNDGVLRDSSQWVWH